MIYWIQFDGWDDIQQNEHYDPKDLEYFVWYNVWKFIVLN